VNTSPPADGSHRTDPPGIAGEYDTVVGYIDFLRQSLAWKIRGLGIDQLRRTLPPSTMTLGGMLAHLAYVEDFWFSRVVGGTWPEPWASTDWAADQDWDWHLVGTSGADDLWGLWEASVARSRAVLRAQLEAHGAEAALATAYRPWSGDDTVSLRWILVHMVEEYGRHVGHADLLRESIDGQTGE
jgi:uncharacterized damage-inducible protein DinB